MNEDILLASKVFIVTIWFVLLFISERIIPHVKVPNIINDNRQTRLYRIARNILLFFINSIVARLCVIPITFLASEYAFSWRYDLINHKIIALMTDIVILDFAIYWWHRLNHKIPFLWRFHEIHHLDNFLDTTSAVRFHFGEVILSSLYRAIIVILCGIPFIVVIMHETILLMASLFHHSNMKTPNKFEKILQLFIVTPNWHWMHHHAVRQDTDSNYANLLTLWDYLFSSHCYRERTNTMPIGVENKKDTSLLRLLINPFKI